MSMEGEVVAVMLLSIAANYGFGRRIERLEGNTYAVDKRYYIQLPEKSTLKVTVRNAGDWQELVAPLGGVRELAYFLVF